MNRDNFIITLDNKPVGFSDKPLEIKLENQNNE